MFIQNVKDAITALEVEIGKVEKRADSNLKKPIRLEKYPDEMGFHFGGNQYKGVNKRAENFFEFEKRNGICPKSLQGVLSRFDNNAQLYLDACEPVRKINENAVENNKEVAARVKEIMQFVGVGETYSEWEYPRANSRNRKETKHNAGYKGDLLRAMSVTDYAYSNIMKRIATKRTEIEKYGNKLIQSQHKARMEKEAAAKETQVTMVMAGLRAKYTPDDLVCEEYELLEVILGTCKYLHLAHYLQKNREDWRGGYSIAECGLSGFDCETQEDSYIHAEISELIGQDDCVDGRVFRDCTWNYDVLYAKVEPTLLKDYGLFIENYEN